LVTGTGRTERFELFQRVVEILLTHIQSATIRRSANRISQATPTPLRRLALAAAAAIGIAGIAAQAAGAQASGTDTYDWSAVLMSFDEASNTAVSPKGATDFEDAILSMRHYNDVG
jgi:hypothetical protein